MNTEQLQAALAECANAYREKMGKSPYLSPTLTLCVAQGWRAYYYGKNYDDDVRVYADHPATAINKLLEEIKALPDPETLAVREVHAEFGALIDKARRIGLDAKHVDPLVKAAREMVESAPGIKVAE